MTYADFLLRGTGGLLEHGEHTGTETLKSGKLNFSILILTANVTMLIFQSIAHGLVVLELTRVVVHLRLKMTIY